MTGRPRGSSLTVVDYRRAFEGAGLTPDFIELPTSDIRPSKTPLPCRCACGAALQLRYDYVSAKARSGSIIQCPACNNLARSKVSASRYVSNESRDHLRKLTLVELQQAIWDRHCEPLFFKNPSYQDSLLLRCRCGYTFTRSYKQSLLKKEVIECNACISLRKTVPVNPLVIPNFGIYPSIKAFRLSLRKQEKMWSRQIKMKFRYRCFLTKVKTRSGNLAVHHLTSVKADPSLILTESNGIPIRADLHREFHSLYDKRNGRDLIPPTREHFAEFYKLKTGRDFEADLKEIA